MGLSRTLRSGLQASHESDEYLRSTGGLTFHGERGITHIGENTADHVPDGLEDTALEGILPSRDVLLPTLRTGRFVVLDPELRQHLPSTLWRET